MPGDHHDVAGAVAVDIAHFTGIPSANLSVEGLSVEPDILVELSSHDRRGGSAAPFITKIEPVFGSG